MPHRRFKKESRGVAATASSGDLGAASISDHDLDHQDFGLITSNMSAMVDLGQSQGGFCEPFYVLLIEKKPLLTASGGASTEMHMWKLVICSDHDEELEGGHVADDDSSTGSITPDAEGIAQSKRMGAAEGCGHDGGVYVVTNKVCCQSLPLPKGVEIIHAVPAAGHLSSASIFPACMAPYLVVTACSDNTIR